MDNNIFSNTKNYIIHDAFLFQGGGERVAVLLSKILHGKLITGQYLPEAIHCDFLEDVKPITLDAYGKHKILAKASLTAALWRSFATMPRISADRVIFSGQVSVLGESRVAGTKVLYCHTPPRMLYDLAEFHRKRVPRYLLPLYDLFVPKYKVAFRKAAQNMNVICANSKNIQRRLKKYLGIDSIVVYPPCGDGFRWLGQEDYYVSIARLDPLKRIDIIIRAFQQMPHKKLVIASSGEDEEKLKELAAPYDNIRFTGRISQKELLFWVGKSIASIYIPQNEDFGMSPVESLAAGKPVIGVAEGGLLETVVHGECGLLVDPPPTPESIIDAVEQLGPAQARSLRHQCEKQASLFSMDSFKASVHESLRGCPR